MNKSLKLTMTNESGVTMNIELTLDDTGLAVSNHVRDAKGNHVDTMDTDDDAFGFFRVVNEHFGQILGLVKQLSSSDESGVTTDAHV